MAQAFIAHFSGESLAQERIPSHAVAAGAVVYTLEGALPVEFLVPGDRLLTRAGARKLIEVEVTTLRNARVVRVTSGALGGARPDGDVILAANQPILIRDWRDWRVRALYGTAQALVPASQLADGEYVRAEVLKEVRLYSLRLAGDEVIYAGGLELACEAAKVTA